MEWVTVRREKRKPIRPRMIPIEVPAGASLYEPPGPPLPPRLSPALVQRFIRRRIRLSLSQDHADVICGFPPRTVNAIESHRLYPTMNQLVAFDAHLTVLEGRLEA